MKKYLAFDLEIANPIPTGALDWKAHRPLGISCACTLRSDMNGETRWYSWSDPTTQTPDGQMTTEACQNLVAYLTDFVQSGYTILTWNGLSFDFDILSEESGLHTECAQLALNHVDMMFHLFALRGHFLGLGKAAKGMRLPGKPGGVDGALAPQMWRDGKYQEVLDYCAQDVRTTLDLALAIESARCLQWLASSGKRNTVDIERLLTVKECLALPLPDTSWMREPVSRDSFVAWMKVQP